MSESDIRSKIETIISKILSRRYDADIEIKFVDQEDNNDKRRNNNRAGRARPNTRKRN